MVYLLIFELHSLFNLKEKFEKKKLKKIGINIWQRF